MSTERAVPIAMLLKFTFFSLEIIKQTGT